MVYKATKQDKEKSLVNIQKQGYDFTLVLAKLLPYICQEPNITKQNAQDKRDEFLLDMDLDAAYGAAAAPAP